MLGAVCDDAVACWGGEVTPGKPGAMGWWARLRCVGGGGAWGVMGGESLTGFIGRGAGYRGRRGWRLRRGWALGLAMRFGAFGLEGGGAEDRPHAP